MAKAKAKVKNQDKQTAQRKTRLQALRKKAISRPAKQEGDDASSGQEVPGRRQALMELLRKKRQGGKQVGEGRRDAGQRLGGGFDETDIQNRPGLKRFLAQRGGGGGRAGAGVGVGRGGGFGSGSAGGRGADVQPVDSSSTPEEITTYRAELTSRAVRLNKELSHIIKELVRVDRMVAGADSDDDVDQSDEPATVGDVRSAWYRRRGR